MAPTDAGTAGPPPAPVPRPASRSAPADHLPALDGLRGVAVLLVVAHHCAPSAKPGGPWEDAVQRAIGSGWIGVDLFFVLSGFLITGILLTARGGPHYFTNFYMRRTLRIFPLYYGVLLGVFFVAPHLPIPWPGGMADVQRHQLWFWLYGTNFMDLFGLPKGLLAHFWTLAVEEHFYLVWPLLVLLVVPRRMIGVCAGIAVAALALRAGLSAYGRGLGGERAQAVDGLILTLTFCRMDALALGGLLAILARDPPFDLYQAARRVLAVSVAVLAGVAVWRTRTFDVAGEHSVAWLNHDDPVVATVGLTLIALAAAALLVFCFEQQAGTAMHRAFRARWLRGLGKYSYGIYVFHFPIVYVLLTDQRYIGLKIDTALNHSLWAVLVRFLVVLGMSFGVAFVSFHCYERPFLRLKRFFEYRKLPVPHTRPAEAASPTAAV